MIKAGYDSTCSCGEPIFEGDTVGLVDEEWVCEGCLIENGEDEEDDLR